ncbi:MAG: DUF2752 domain-containing protein [Pirellulaceae bacterium]|jgi:hypothetical protein|nr:DUF2752 domain-containing protein [Pirellulaceae bacterium]
MLCRVLSCPQVVVTDICFPMQPAFPILQRGLLGLVLLVLLALLATARCLEPADRGVGTHQQLGLPACMTRVVWGVPCPACGMTTSWALATRGQWTLAAHANAGGFLLCLIALALVPTSCYWLAVGKTSPSDRTWLTLGMSLLVALAVAIAQWGWRLLH